jgi:hypothetical protein
MKLQHVAVTLCCTLLSGCWPYHYTSQPGVSGVVVAAPGANPLAGAQVALAVQIRNGTPTILEVATDEQGRFKLSPQRLWSMFVVGQEAFPPRKCVVSVTAPQFVKISRDINCSEMGPAHTDLGTIALERATP